MKQVICFLIFLTCSITNPIGLHAQNIDIDILRAINSNESSFGDKTCSFLSHTATPVAVGVPLVHGVVGFLTKDKSLQQKSYVMAGGIASAMLISFGLKYTINRARPYVTYPDLNDKASDFTPSFPSGHTTSAFATATALSLAWRKWYVVVPAYTWASGVAYSRLYMGVHYPSDVLAGALIGSGTAYLSWKLNKWIRGRKAQTITPQ